MGEDTAGAETAETKTRKGGGPRFAAHPNRAQILGEIHARPFRLVSPPRVFLHHAFDVAPGKTAAADRAVFNGIAKAQGLQGPGDDVRHHVMPFGGGTLKWERHSEFST